MWVSHWGLRCTNLLLGLWCSKPSSWDYLPLQGLIHQCEPIRPLLSLWHRDQWDLCLLYYRIEWVHLYGKGPGSFWSSNESQMESRWEAANLSFNRLLNISVELLWDCLIYMFLYNNSYMYTLVLIGWLLLILAFSVYFIRQSMNWQFITLHLCLR